MNSLISLPSDLDTRQIRMHLFTQQVFLEHVICQALCPHQGYSREVGEGRREGKRREKKNKVLSLKELTV